MLSSNIEDYLKAKNYQSMKDGEKLIMLMKGRRKLGVFNDAEMIDLVKAGLRIDICKI